jgi:Protein of unknown function (DUF2911)
MKKVTLISLLIAVFLIVTVMPTLAQRGDDSERKSKNGKVEATIDGVKVVIHYGQPNVNGRAIWGGLVPYDKVWRTGANEATTISFSKDASVEGNKIAAGTYALFTIPGKTEWTILFNKVAKQWGNSKYDKANDVLAVKVKPAACELVEAMTFKIDGNKIILMWEKLMVAFKVAAAK